MWCSRGAGWYCRSGDRSTHTPPPRSSGQGTGSGEPVPIPRTEQGDRLGREDARNSAGGAELHRFALDGPPGRLDIDVGQRGKSALAHPPHSHQLGETGRIRSSCHESFSLQIAVMTVHHTVCTFIYYTSLSYICQYTALTINQQRGATSVQSENVSSSPLSHP